MLCYLKFLKHPITARAKIRGIKANIIISYKDAKQDATQVHGNKQLTNRRNETT